MTRNNIYINLNIKLNSFYLRYLICLIMRTCISYHIIDMRENCVKFEWNIKFYKQIYATHAYISKFCEDTSRIHVNWLRTLKFSYIRLLTLWNRKKYACHLHSLNKSDPLVNFRIYLYMKTWIYKNCKFL